MDVSIICVNWNSVHYLKECIASIFEHTHSITFEIIVIDNASPNRDVDTLTELFPDVIILKSERNLGFSGANNLAFRSSSGAYVLFLNPDTRLVSPAIQTMLKYLRSLPNAGIVGCKLLNTDGSIQTSCIQTYPTILNQVTDLEYLRVRWPSCPLWNIGPLFSCTTQVARVEVVSGACMMMKREVFDQVGLFSEEYFMYAEDIDISYKVARAGYTAYYLSEAVVVHHGGRSSGQRTVNQWATIMKFRAMTQFCLKTRGKAYSVAFRYAMGCAALARLACITAMFPFGRVFLQHRLAAPKWSAVLRWAVGLEGQLLTSPKDE